MSLGSGRCHGVCAGGGHDHYRRAAREAHEAIVGFEVAVAWGWLNPSDVADGIDKLKHVLAVLAKVR